MTASDALRFVRWDAPVDRWTGHDPSTCPKHGGPLTWEFRCSLETHDRDADRHMLNDVREPFHVAWCHDRDGDGWHGYVADGESIAAMLTNGLSAPDQPISGSEEDS